MNGKSIFVLSYVLMLIVGLTLPSDGNHGILSPKSLTFLASFFSLIAYFVMRWKVTNSQLKLVAFTLCSVTVVLTWWAVFFFSDPIELDSAMDQFKLFIITLLFTVITLYLVSEHLISPQKILRIVIYANFTYCLAKVSFVALHLLKIINMWSLIELTGFRFMKMGIVGGISRLQTSVDIVTPFLLLFVLSSSRLGLGFSKKFSFSFYIISLLSIFLSFSRFLLFIAAICYVLYWATTSFKRQLLGVGLCFLACFAVTAFVGFETMTKIVDQRLFSRSNYNSDLERTQQIDALTNEFYQTPYLGKGVGGYAPDLLRDNALKHSYEVQWVAFLMQFGIIGLFFLLIPVGIISSRFLVPPLSRPKLAFLALFSLWILSGFTNPFLISLTSGIVYSIFLLAAFILNEEPEFSRGSERTIRTQRTLRTLVSSSAATDEPTNVPKVL